MSYGAASIANPKKIVFIRSGAFLEAFGSCAKVIERCLGKKYYNIEKDKDKAPVLNVGIPAHEQSRTIGD